MMDDQRCKQDFMKPKQGCQASEFVFPFLRMYHGVMHQAYFMS